MEFVKGEEHTTDPLSIDGKTLLCPVKTRENERAGLAMKFVQKENQKLVDSTKYIIEKLKAVVSYIIEDPSLRFS